MWNKLRRTGSLMQVRSTCQSHLSSDAIFAPIFSPFSNQLHSLSLSCLSPSCLSSYVSFFLMLITLTNRQQELNSIVQLVTEQLDLLGYRHPKKVLFLLRDPILCWNPFSHPLLFPSFKVPGFPDTEHK